ncbi:hypothetical protein DSO57_1008136 [Entomophthora muscae]|nr:hypothetical protein DSO57_1008136 [Entomophthora muscae]
MYATECMQRVEVLVPLGAGSEEGSNGVAELLGRVALKNKVDGTRFSEWISQYGGDCQVQVESSVTRIQIRTGVADHKLVIEKLLLALRSPSFDANDIEEALMEALEAHASRLETEEAQIQEAILAHSPLATRETNYGEILMAWLLKTQDGKLKLHQVAQRFYQIEGLCIQLLVRGTQKQNKSIRRGLVMHQTMKEASSFSGSLLTLVPINENRRYLEAHFSIHPKLDALVEKVLARRWKNSLFVEWEKIGWIDDIRWERVKTCLKMFIGITSMGLENSITMISQLFHYVELFRNEKTIRWMLNEIEATYQNKYTQAEKLKLIIKSMDLIFPHSTRLYLISENPPMLPQGNTLRIGKLLCIKHTIHELITASPASTWLLPPMENPYLLHMPGESVTIKAAIFYSIFPINKSITQGAKATLYQLIRYRLYEIESLSKVASCYFQITISDQGMFIKAYGSLDQLSLITNDILHRLNSTQAQSETNLSILPGSDFLSRESIKEAFISTLKDSFFKREERIFNSDKKEITRPEDFFSEDHMVKEMALLCGPTKIVLSSTRLQLSEKDFIQALPSQPPLTKAYSLVHQVGNPTSHDSGVFFYLDITNHPTSDIWLQLELICALIEEFITTKRNEVFFGLGSYTVSLQQINLHLGILIALKGSYCSSRIEIILNEILKEFEDHFKNMSPSTIAYRYRGILSQNYSQNNIKWEATNLWNGAISGFLNPHLRYIYNFPSTFEYSVDPTQLKNETILILQTSINGPARRKVSVHYSLNRIVEPIDWRTASSSLPRDKEAQDQSRCCGDELKALADLSKYI